MTEEIQVIQSQLDRLPGLADGVEKAGAIDKLKKKIRGAKGTKRSFKMEIRLVQDVNQRRKYESRLNSLDQQLQTLVADCKAIEAENNRGELFVGGGEDGMDPDGMTGEEAGDRMLKEASALQDKTQDSLSNTKQLIAQSKEVGMATLEELERQRGVIENINSEVLRVDDNLARAEKLVRKRKKSARTWMFPQRKIRSQINFSSTINSSNNLENAWQLTVSFNVLPWWIASCLLV